MEKPNLHIICTEMELLGIPSFRSLALHSLLPKIINRSSLPIQKRKSVIYRHIKAPFTTLKHIDAYVESYLTNTLFTASSLIFSWGSSL